MNYHGLSLIVVISSIAPSWGADKVDYAHDIQPILSANCFACHGFDPATVKGGLRLDKRDLAVKKLKSGSFAIVPGNVQKSELVTRLHADADEVMPPAKTGKKLSDREKKLLKDWVEQGAEYQAHWSFVKPTASKPPKTKQQGWVRQGMRFIHLAANRKEQAHSRSGSGPLHAGPANRDRLDGAAADGGDGGSFRQATRNRTRYERYVDEVMKLPAFGERWAQVWLDLARYADSNGYAEDQPRTIWTYRDWVIEAINANLPFDQFTIEQIAGDMLPNPTADQLVATAFHRNTLTNTEGGTNDEEFRNIAVVDRVNTTLQVWMGLTMGCAQCHDHKYDPITQEEYFRVFAIFNQTEDSDKKDNTPNLPYMSPVEAQQKKENESKLAELDKKLRSLRPKIDLEQAEWEKAVQADSRDGRRCPSRCKRSSKWSVTNARPSRPRRSLASSVAPWTTTSKNCRSR